MKPTQTLTHVAVAALLAALPAPRRSRPAGVNSPDPPGGAAAASGGRGSNQGGQGGGPARKLPPGPSTD